MLYALLSGFIIFPACFAFGVNPDSGPNLIFITLPNIFNSMAGGRIWGSIFFLCMLFAAASTIIAVFENNHFICDGSDRMLERQGSGSESGCDYPAFTSMCVWI